MSNYLLLFLVGFLGSLALTPAVRWLAFRLKALDMPGERKVHTEPVPRLGGLAIFVAFHLGLLLGFVPLMDLSYYLKDFSAFWLMRLLPAVLVIVALGVVDDIHPLQPSVKLLVQILAALLAVRGGCVIQIFDLPWMGQVKLGWWGPVVTVIWILALTNAFNLIDGLDGLSCGIGLISTVTLGAVALLRQDTALVLVCALLAGGLAGFLRHNFHPARIFMGDTGSLFLGFALALLSVSASHKTTASLSIVVPLLAFGVPLMEASLSVLRRAALAIQDGEGRLSRLFVADRDHVHHRLLKLGFSHPRAVLILYAVSLVPAGLTLLLVAQRNPNLGLVFAVVGVATMYAVRRLRYRELEFLRNGALLSWSQTPLLSYRFFQIPLDLALTAVALYLAGVIGIGRVLPVEVKESLRASAALVVAIKLLVLHLNGLYLVRWQYAGLADVLRVARAMVIASAVTTVLLWLIGQPGFSVAVVIMDFYVTLTLLLGVRMSLRLLTHYAQLDDANKERVIIYGTGSNAEMLVRHLLAEGKTLPVGFIHGGEEQRGKTIHGFPILGVVSALPALVREYRVDKLIIAKPELPSEQFEGLHGLCREADIEVQLFRVGLETVSPPR